MKLITLVNSILPGQFERDLLLSYMAACVQYKGVKLPWAVILAGPKGCGKASLLKVLMYATEGDVMGIDVVEVNPKFARLTVDRMAAGNDNFFITCDRVAPWVYSNNWFRIVTIPSLADDHGMKWEFARFVRTEEGLKACAEELRAYKIPAYCNPVINCLPLIGPGRPPRSDEPYEPWRPRREVPGSEPTQSPERREEFFKQWVGRVGLCDPGPLSVKSFKNFLQTLTSNEAEYLALLSYMAACVQYPTTGFQWALVLSGPQGCGKGLLTKVLKKACNRGSWQHIDDPAQVTVALSGFTYPGSTVFIDNYAPEGTHPAIVKAYIAAGIKFFITTWGRIAWTYHDRHFLPLTIHKSFPREVAADFGQVLSRTGAMEKIAEFLRTYRIPEYYDPSKQTRPPELRWDVRGRAVPGEDGSSVSATDRVIEEVCDKCSDKVAAWYAAHPDNFDTVLKIVRWKRSVLNRPVAANTQPTITPGAVVRLKGGGPMMTVSNLNGTKAECVWFGNGQYNGGTGTYSTVCLELIPSPASGPAPSDPSPDFIDLSGGAS